MAESFIEKLRDAQQRHDSWLCVGLDPNPERIPAGMDLLTFGQRIVEATAEYACAFKPNLAFYLASGSPGLDALGETIAHVPDGVPVVLDAKFGDIGYTTARYAQLAYDVLGADAVTVSPYVGMDAVTPFLDYANKMAFVLVRSANTTGNDFQLWPSDRSPLFRFVTAQLNTLGNQYPDRVGITAAATQARDLGRIRSWAPSLPFLVPGLGVQGGDLRPSVEHGPTRTGIGPLISVTRSIIYAGETFQGDFFEGARAAAEDWAGRICGLSRSMTR
ncbi:MAG: orotidine-5'-phosphate decarboxylase [Chloroflexi bacterium]|nr:orotidine-5'-phosphate decarboxylase [Chloroflexota bacterium]